MHQLLFDHNASWNADNIHIPQGHVDDLEREARRYENQLKQIGQPDIQLLVLVKMDTSDSMSLAHLLKVKRVWLI